MVAFVDNFDCAFARTQQNKIENSKRYFFMRLICFIESKSNVTENIFEYNAFPTLPIKTNFSSTA
jgi:hypothetical protein